jgi:phenylalanyl-tRNA synthetase alpha chain
MQKNIQEIESRVSRELEGSRSLPALEELRVRVLGRKGELTGLLRSLGQAPAEERPRLGQMVNAAPEKIERPSMRAPGPSRARQSRRG